MKSASTSGRSLKRRMEGGKKEGMDGGRLGRSKRGKEKGREGGRDKEKRGGEGS